jgi:cell division protein FtsW (lipid II flippase)
MQSFKTLFQEWSTQHDSFTKLQHAYITIAILALLIAGIIGLINHPLGQSILFIAVCALLIFIANGVVWALLRTFLSPKADKSVSTRKK